MIVGKAHHQTIGQHGRVRPSTHHSSVGLAVKMLGNDMERMSSSPPCPKDMGPPTRVPLAKIDNSFISHNEAECTGIYDTEMAQGGGIYAASATPDPEEDLSFGIKICNSTIADNKTIIPDEAATKSGGGGFYSKNQKAEVTNSIFWGNVSPENGTQIGVEETVEIAYSDIDETVGGCSLGTGIWVHPVTGLLICLDGNLNVDPSFVDPDIWDYHLETDSLVIDRGDTGSACGDYDIDLDDRVCEDDVDMGADEVCD